MNDSHLKKSLSALSTPQPDAVAKERALHRALIALHATGSQALPLEKAHSRLWRPAFALIAVALFAVGFMLSFRQDYGDEFTAMAQTLRELEALFPRQINAIVEEKGEPQLDLAAEPGVSPDQPIYVEVTQGERVIRIISYSGRTVTVALDDEELTFEPLLSGSGEVILVSKDFVWSAEDPAPKDGYQIIARPLLFPS